MSMIYVESLGKSFRRYRKEAGLAGSFRALFKRSYEQSEALKNISFQIEQGELVGFIGPNGAGKTTTLKCLSGIMSPSSGRLEVLGFEPHRREYAFLRQIALVMGQKNHLWWDLPADDSFNLTKEIYQIDTSKFNETKARLVELLGLSDFLDVQVRKLSLGQRMRCEVANALLHSPRLLFLDEPTIGLDVIAQKALRSFLAEINREFGVTILLTSHYMEDVRELCKRVIVIRDGEILYDGSLDGLIKDYADFKYISVRFAQKIERGLAERIGELVEVQGNLMRFRIDRGVVSKKSAEILNHFEVEDLDIAEPGLDEIIRGIFQN